MSTKIRLFLVALFAAIGVITPVSPVHAITIAYVEDHTGSAWPVNYVQGWVDQWTGSDLRYGACRSGYECVKVYEKTIRSEWGAYTCAGNSVCLGVKTSYWRIYVNPQRNGQAYGLRVRYLAHEFGHWRGIWYHSDYCTNVMYYTVKCPNGSWVTLRYSDPQKAILRTH